MIIIIISWESTFKGVGTSGRGSNFSPNFATKITARKAENSQKQMYSLKKQRVTGFCGQWILQLVTLLEAYSGFLVHVPLSGMYVRAIRYLCTCSNY